MKTHYAVSQQQAATMTTAQLRETFLFDELFVPGSVSLHYCEADRAVIGAAVPTAESLLLPTSRALAADTFCARRELGVLNIGAPGTITVDGKEYLVAPHDCLYIGRGAQRIEFASRDANQPARYYLVSYPAHASYPTVHMAQEAATPVKLGSPTAANQRTIYQYIHEGGIRSCQLVMGFTALEPGSVWNTMPPHTHERRTEIYLYFGLPANAAVFHFMGPRHATRHLVVRHEQAVLSPPWSIHCGAGTQAYQFCWAMGGENQQFTDMDGIPVEDLR